MAFTPKDLTGRIFDNVINKKHDKQPDFTGTINVHGEIFKVSAWYSPPSPTARVGSYSLRLQNKDEYDQQRRNKKSDDANKQPGSATPPL